MKTEYQYDQDPRYGWVSIDLEGAKSTTVIIHGPNGSEGFVYRDGEMKPACICSAWNENECACSNLPYDYWKTDEIGE